ncbi:hypothetical protein LguiA_024553 [Lonicera macranthoides]
MADNNQNGLKSPQVTIVVVPFPAQGHLNQLLHLSRLLLAYNLIVHYVGTTTNIRQARLRLHGCDPLSTSSSIHFHEFETPPFLSPPPDPTAPSAFPSHLMPAFDASTHLREPVEALLRNMSLDAHRIVVIHDSLMATVVQDVATIPGVESYTFETPSAFCLFWFIVEIMGKPCPIDDEVEKEVPSIEGCLSPEFLDFLKKQEKHVDFNSGRLYNTCKSIEGKYINLLTKEDISGKTMHWFIGPLNPVNQNKKRHSCLDWLDEQAPNSVIFVSFGTTTTFTDEQINEIAVGLEQSGQKFIWVLRDADKGDVFDENVRMANLPKGYEERIEGKGIVVRDWAPQLEILAHSGTGGFMSHCGWNSCMESITHGVPMATWPVHSDQPYNAVLITKVLRTGVAVKDWKCRNEMVTALMVERGVRRLMVDREGEELGKRAAELGRAVKRAVAEGGISRVDFDGGKRCEEVDGGQRRGIIEEERGKVGWCGQKGGGRWWR